jgi:hypothetical protein
MAIIAPFDLNTAKNLAFAGDKPGRLKVATGWKCGIVDKWCSKAEGSSASSAMPHSGAVTPPMHANQRSSIRLNCSLVYEGSPSRTDLLAETTVLSKQSPRAKGSMVKSLCGDLYRQRRKQREFAPDRRLYVRRWTKRIFI